MSNGQANDPGTKANEIAIEALKQLLTLASGVLALTITFIKDALDTSRSKASYTFLVPIAWCLLALAIWTGWVAIPDACRKMTLKSDYVFESGRPRVLAKIAQSSFLLGLILLTVFAVLNFRLFFTASEAIKSVAP
jgi:hypothetical protein